MREQSPSPKPFLARRTVLVANLVILALVAWGFAGEYLRNSQAQAEITALQLRTASLEARNEQLAQLGASFGTIESLEREARLKLGLQKPGEQVIIIKDLPSFEAVGEPVAVAAATATVASNPLKWWRYFFSPKQR